MKLFFGHQSIVGGFNLACLPSATHQNTKQLVRTWEKMTH